MTPVFIIGMIATALLSLGIIFTVIEFKNMDEQKNGKK